LFARLEAFNGLILAAFWVMDEETCVARLQFPISHFKEGSGHAEQYQPDEYSDVRLHPLQLSTI
jgi:hypothetical protein